MANKLYVGSLSYDTTTEALIELFSQAGAILETEDGQKSVSLIYDKFTGRPKGFGFVEMADEAGAQKAIEMFDGYELDGWKIIVNEARPLKPRTEGGYNRGGNSRPGGYGGNSRPGNGGGYGGNSRPSNSGGYDRDNRSRDW